jgi:hypothetical protein
VQTRSCGGHAGFTQPQMPGTQINLEPTYPLV